MQDKTRPCARGPLELLLFQRTGETAGRAASFFLSPTAGGTPCGHVTPQGGGTPTPYGHVTPQGGGIIRPSMSQEFHPEQIPRSGERNAWLITALAVAAWFVLLWRADTLSWVGLFIVLFLLFAALSISLGNWMDRHTVLTLGGNQITYNNGIRDLALSWDQVQEVRISPNRWGERVQVLGFDEAKPSKGQSACNVGFVFHTLGEVAYQGKMQGRTGFKQGQFILNQILELSSLEEKSNDQQGRYYARL